MSQTLTVRFECDRCSRQWFVDYNESEKKPVAASFNLELKYADGSSSSVTFETLCETCKKSVSNYIASIGKEIKNKSPERAPKEAKEPKEEPGAKQNLPKGKTPAHGQASATAPTIGKTT